MCCGSVVESCFQWADLHRKLHNFQHKEKVKRSNCRIVYLPSVSNTSNFTYCQPSPSVVNINNNTKLLSVKHTYIYCTYVLHGQHVSTHHRVIIRPLYTNTDPLVIVIVLWDPIHLHIVAECTLCLVGPSWGI